MGQVFNIFEYRSYLSYYWGKCGYLCMSTWKTRHANKT